MKTVSKVVTGLIFFFRKYFRALSVVCAVENLQSGSKSSGGCWQVFWDNSPELAVDKNTVVTCNLVVQPRLPSMSVVVWSHVPVLGYSRVHLTPGGSTRVSRLFIMVRGHVLPEELERSQPLNGQGQNRDRRKRAGVPWTPVCPEPPFWVGVQPSLSEWEWLFNKVYSFYFNF